MGLYDRQKDIKINVNQSLTVVGCGGIGYWVCKYAAMSGVDKIYAFDPDVIEESNLNRLDIPERFVGKNKADVTKIVVNTIRPNCTFYSMPFKFNDAHDLHTDWLIDCTDNGEAQETNYKIAKDQGMKYVKLGYNGTHISINDKLASWGEAPDGYTIIPSWIVPSSIIAAMGIAKVLKYWGKELSCDIERMFII
jgi:tRNA A37 threonylcarbamoyladenosine dehydratase